MATSKFLAFDLGAESGRAVLGTLSGQKLTLEEKHRFANPNGKMNGRLQWNLLAQWEEIKTGLRKAGEVVRDDGLAGVGVDTWGVDFGLILPSGELMGNPTMYRDPATEGVMEQTFAKHSKEEIFRATGIQFMRINSLFQLLAMQETHPKMLEAAGTLLFMPDLFNFLLSGSRKSEMSIASTSQMCDPNTGTWAMELLK